MTQEDHDPISQKFETRPPDSIPCNNRNLASCNLATISVGPLVSFRYLLSPAIGQEAGGWQLDEGLNAWLCSCNNYFRVYTAAGDTTSSSSSLCRRHVLPFPSNRLLSGRRDNEPNVSSRCKLSGKGRMVAFDLKGMDRSLVAWRDCRSSGVGTRLWAEQ